MQYTMVCRTGSAVHPQLDVLIEAGSLPRAKDQCFRIAKRLWLAGYCDYFIYRNDTGETVFDFKASQPEVSFTHSVKWDGAEHGGTRMGKRFGPDNPIDSLGTYYAEDGTLMNANGTRSIFDDVDAVK